MAKRKLVGSTGADIDTPADMNVSDHHDSRMWRGFEFRYVYPDEGRGGRRGDYDEYRCQDICAKVRIWRSPGMVVAYIMGQSTNSIEFAHALDLALKGLESHMLMCAKVYTQICSSTLDVNRSSKT